MRLRTRLAITFAALAIVPLVLVLPFAQTNLRATLSRELEGRMDAAATAARTALQQRSEDVSKALDELAGSVAMEEVAQDLRANQPPGRQAATAERLMKGRRLGVLSLFDDKGVTLSSGHLPARLGDPDEALFHLTRLEGMAPVAVMVELGDAAGLKQVPALAAARPVDGGEPRLWVVGGTLLDAELAEHLSRLTGARVDLLWQGGVVATAGKGEPPSIERLVDVSPGFRVRLSLSREALDEAERGVTRAFALLAFLGLASAVLLGLVAARWITSPVEALTAGVRRIAQGEMRAKVETRASGEVGELVSAFNRMTDELQRTTEQLVASERVAAWQEVARRLAHEIKNPLTPIKMSLETLLAAHGAKSRQFDALFKESAQVVLEEVERLRRIVDEFSHFARLPKPRLAAVDLSELAGQVLSLYAAPPPGVELQKELGVGLTVQADRDQLTQVLVNLIKNAEEVLPGGGRIFVRVKARGAGQAVVEVEDTGPGIKPEDRGRVFEPYFTTKQGGTGLGLAIASRICQEHGGALEVGGESGQGALFTVVLPRAFGP